MRPRAFSLEARTSNAEDAARRMTKLAAKVESASGGLVFATGALGDQLPILAQNIALACSRLPWLVVSSPGIMTERGEVEGESAAVGLVISGGKVDFDCVAGTTPHETFSGLCASIAANPTQPRLLLARSTGFSSETMNGIGKMAGEVCLFGAATPSRHPPQVVTKNGKLISTNLVLASFEQHGRPILATSSACRLLTLPLEITHHQGPVVLTLGGRPALEVLEEASGRLGENDLILAALIPSQPSETETTTPAFLVRMLSGVDPIRGGLVLGEAPAPGTRLAIAVRDRDAARQNLKEDLRELRQRLAGAAPSFGLYLDCVGRGRGLYGVPDVDLKQLRQSLSDAPLLGLRSAFEIAPLAGQPVIHTFTGLLALFTLPS